MHNFLPHLTGDTLPRNAIIAEYAHAVFLPGCVKTVLLSEDFTNYNAYFDIFSTTFMQCILSDDTIFYLKYGPY